MTITRIAVRVAAAGAVTAALLLAGLPASAASGAPRPGGIAAHDAGATPAPSDDGERTHLLSVGASAVVLGVGVVVFTIRPRRRGRPADPRRAEAPAVSDRR